MANPRGLPNLEMKQPSAGTRFQGEGGLNIDGPALPVSKASSKLGARLTSPKRSGG